MKSKFSLIFTILLIIIVLSVSIIISSCSSKNEINNDTSLALIKNASMSTYGTGFAVGLPGKAADTIITSCGAVATANGNIPKTAGIRIKDSEKELTANVIYFNVQRNIAILKLSEPENNLKLLVLNDTPVSEEADIIVRGYDGTGNIMSDFEKFNSTNIVHYVGNIIDSSEVNDMTVYKYSNEFNRALAGAPAVNSKGICVGMCAYSLKGMNTYSQYIMPSEEIIKVLVNENITFITKNEVKYRNIILIAIIAGIIVLAAIIIFTVLYIKKNENKPDQMGRYIKITGGTLLGKTANFKDKITIGRDESKCDVVYPVNEPGISALHCSVIEQNKDIYIVDNFSSFGTYLENGTKIEASVPYKVTDSITVFYIADPKNRIELHI